ncbi:MAG: hypothetical protein PVG39_02495 [Desulfobacteraceae bacterium]|jgi:hypothetical protein
MGLDMFLEREIYVGAESNYRKVTGNIELYTHDKPIKVNFNKVFLITEQIGYWRKANHIHQWFVNNVQDGKDDCKRYYVPVDELKTLRDLCKDIMTKCLLHESIIEGHKVWDSEDTTGFLKKQPGC